MTATIRPEGDSATDAAGLEGKTPRRLGRGRRRDQVPPAAGRRDLSKRGLPARPRQKGLLTAAVLVLVVFGLLGALFFVNAGSKTAVLAVGPQTVSKGQVVERGDLVSEQISGGTGLVSVEQIDQVVGKRAATDLVSGQLLTGQMVTSDPVPGEGKATVGLSLSSAQVPGDGLEPGDVVDVIAVPGEQGNDGRAVDADGLDKPETIATGAQVYGIRGSGSSGGEQLVTVIVDDGEAGRLAAYSTSNRVALVETSPATGGSDDADASGSGG